MTVRPGLFVKAMNRRSRAFFVAFWDAIPSRRPSPLKHIDHQFIQNSSSEFSIPSSHVDPRTYIDRSTILFAFWG